MISYYELTKSLNDFLQADEDINNVKLGQIDEVDINKQTVFPFANILVNSAEFLDGMVRFNVEVSVMDIVDIRKDNIDELTGAERWKGQDNKQDILNAMLSVIERLVKYVNKGALADEAYYLDSHSVEPFEARFENLLTGWVADMVIDIPNNVQNC